jgi:hypothetical protein
MSALLVELIDDFWPDAVAYYAKCNDEQAANDDIEAAFEKLQEKYAVVYAKARKENFGELPSSLEDAGFDSRVFEPRGRVDSEGRPQGYRCVGGSRSNWDKLERFQRQLFAIRRLAQEEAARMDTDARKGKRRKPRGHVGNYLVALLEEDPRKTALSQPALAELLRCSQGTLSRVLNNRRFRPQLERIYRDAGRKMPTANDF